MEVILRVGTGGVESESGGGPPASPLPYNPTPLLRITSTLFMSTYTPCSVTRCTFIHCHLFSIHCHQMIESDNINYHRQRFAPVPVPSPPPLCLTHPCPLPHIHPTSPTLPYSPLCLTLNPTPSPALLSTPTLTLYPPVPTLRITSTLFMSTYTPCLVIRCNLGAGGMRGYKMQDLVTLELEG